MPTTLVLLCLTVLVVIALRGAERVAKRTKTLTARRWAGVFQLAKWIATVSGASALLYRGLAAAGTSPANMALIFAAGVSGLAVAMREPIADFIAVVTFLIERAAAIGDEVELNAEVRGRLVGFGIRSVAVLTWDGDTVYYTGSSIRTFRNVSQGASRAIVDVDIPARVRTGRARVVLEATLAQVRDDTFQSAPEVLGVVSQHLERYVMRVSCLVEPAKHKEAEYRLKAAAVDAVSDMIDHVELPTQELLAVVVEPDPHEAHSVAELVGTRHEVRRSRR